MKRVLLGLVVVVLLVAIGLQLHFRATAPPPPPTAAEFAALEADRDALQERFRVSVTKAGESSLAKAPRAGVMIGLPTSFASSIVEQVVTGLFGETTLTLRNLKVHKEGDVKAKMLFRKKQVGQFVLDVDIQETRGILKPGKPILSFGENRIGVILPVTLAEGGGRAQIRFQWDSKGLAANAVCGDKDITRDVHGKVIPEEYRVAGAFGIRADGSAITLTPDFGEVVVKLFVDPSEDAWKVVDGVVAEQRAGCRAALDKIDIKAILGKILGRGFNVKLPRKLFKPVRLPAGIRQSLDVQGITLDLTVAPTGMLVSDDRIWYGADLHAKRMDSPPTPAGAAPAKTAAPPSVP